MQGTIYIINYHYHHHSNESHSEAAIREGGNEGKPIYHQNHVLKI